MKASCMVTWSHCHVLCIERMKFMNIGHASTWMSYLIQLESLLLCWNAKLSFILNLKSLYYVFPLLTLISMLQFEYFLVLLFFPFCCCNETNDLAMSSFKSIMSRCRTFQNFFESHFFVNTITLCSQFWFCLFMRACRLQIHGFKILRT